MIFERRLIVHAFKASFKGKVSSFNQVVSESRFRIWAKFPGLQIEAFRAEYAAFSLAIVAYLIWRSNYLGGIDWLQVIFWSAFPDLTSFIPIGASSKRREWP